jgi:hypothetical protein
MTSYPKPSPPPQVFPQIGAILHLDTTLGYPYPGVELGNKHWQLDGSCVLVAPDRILTIRHTLGKTAAGAAFFPYEGLVPLDDERVEDYGYGDALCLCRLKWPLRFARPFEYEHVSRERMETAIVGGYGQWSGLDGWDRDGVQRSAEVKLRQPGQEPGKIDDGDNLDLQWTSTWNQGLAAGRNNSGGALLFPRPDGLTLVGVSRETKGATQAASRIAHNRATDWLPSQLKLALRQPPVDPIAREPARELLVRHDLPGVAERFAVPLGATGVRLTLSATAGLRLQMGIGGPGDETELLAGLCASDESSGRFLYRKERLAEGASEIVVGVARVERAPREQEQVRAQLCCMFI